jgi:hypothetical protein
MTSAGFGSRAVYAEPYEDLRQKKRDARASGIFPEVGKSSEEYLHRKLQQINKGKEVSAIQQRRRALDDRHNYELQTEQAMQDMRENRMPGFRGLGARMVGADQAAQQFYNGNY